MARHETDREDLFAEATALVRRGEFGLRGQTVVAGFHRDGGLSLYLSAGQISGDPAYHFDPAGRLRRAFHTGRLYRTQGETLAELTRERSADETTLVRRDLSDEELRRFLSEMTGRLANVQVQLRDGRFTMMRQVPEGDPALPGDLAAVIDPLVREGVSFAPRFKGKR